MASKVGTGRGKNNVHIQESSSAGCAHNSHLQHLTLNVTGCLITKYSEFSESAVEIYLFWMLSCQLFITMRNFIQNDVLNDWSSAYLWTLQAHWRKSGDESGNTICTVPPHLNVITKNLQTWQPMLLNILFDDL